MKTRTRTHKSLDKIVEDIQKTEIQENSDNLLHHQNFFSRKKYTSDFKKYLWKEIYAEKNLYMMFYCTMITLGIIMLLILTYEAFLNSNDTLLTIITLALITMYFLSFPFVRRHYKRKLNNPNHKYIFKSIRGNKYSFEKRENNEGGHTYII